MSFQLMAIKILITLILMKKLKGPHLFFKETKSSHIVEVLRM